MTTIVECWDYPSKLNSYIFNCNFLSFFSLQIRNLFHKHTHSNKQSKLFYYRQERKKNPHKRNITYIFYLLYFFWDKIVKVFILLISYLFILFVRFYLLGSFVFDVSVWNLNMQVNKRKWNKIKDKLYFYTVLTQKNKESKRHNFLDFFFIWKFAVFFSFHKINSSCFMILLFFYYLLV